MNAYAYRMGCRAALEKFGGSSASPPANDGASSYRDSGSPIATTSFHGMQRAIDQGWLANANLGFTSNFTDPGFRNNTLHGGPPLKPFTSDTSGGLGGERESS